MLGTWFHFVRRNNLLGFYINLSQRIRCVVRNVCDFRKILHNCTQSIGAIGGINAWDAQDADAAGGPGCQGAGGSGATGGTSQACGPSQLGFGIDVLPVQQEE